MPSIERVRFVNSGTEATMSAMRWRAAVTKRDKIIKFDGCYHGHADSLLVKAGSGALTFGSRESRRARRGPTRNAARPLQRSRVGASASIPRQPGGDRGA